MITTNEKRPPRSWKRSTLLISCLLLLLLGGVYWQQTTAEPPVPVVVDVAAPVLEKPASAPSIASTADVKADSAQNLPAELPFNRTSVVKRMTKPSKVRYETERTHVPVLSETMASEQREPVVPVAQPVVAPVTMEARPKTAEYAAISQPVELKPVVQPIPVAAAVTSPVSTSVPMPITASATSLPKRKAKNDEDVEIDPE